MSKKDGYGDPDCRHVDGTRVSPSRLYECCVRCGRFHFYDRSKGDPWRLPGSPILVENWENADNDGGAA